MKSILTAAALGVRPHGVARDDASLRAVEAEEESAKEGAARRRHRD